MREIACVTNPPSLFLPPVPRNAVLGARDTHRHAAPDHGPNVFRPNLMWRTAAEVLAPLLSHPSNQTGVATTT